MPLPASRSRAWPWLAWGGGLLALVLVGGARSIVRRSSPAGNSNGSRSQAH